MKAKVLLLPDDPPLRLRLAPLLEGVEVRSARDEFSARTALEGWRSEAFARNLRHHGLSVTPCVS